MKRKMWIWRVFNEKFQLKLNLYKYSSRTKGKIKMKIMKDSFHNSKAFKYTQLIISYFLSRSTVGDFHDTTKLFGSKR